jgi:hypothetical protein
MHDFVVSLFERGPSAGDFNPAVQYGFGLGESFIGAEQGDGTGQEREYKIFH